MSFTQSNKEWVADNKPWELLIAKLLEITPFTCDTLIVHTQINKYIHTSISLFVHTSIHSEYQLWTDMKQIWTTTNPLDNFNFITDELYRIRT